MQPLILLGGTFDPIHIGHLTLAQILSDTFEDMVTFLPTGNQGYKAKSTTTTLERAEMLTLAIRYNPIFNIDNTEINNDEICYSYKTLTKIRKRVGPDRPIFFLIGSDSLTSLDTWENWQELTNLVNFIVAMRPGYDQTLMSPKLAAHFHSCYRPTLDKQSTHGHFYPLEFTPMDISSTKIRSLVQNKQSTKGLVPDIIEKYIVDHRLYFN